MIQINGKKRGLLKIKKNISEDELLMNIKKEKNISKYLENQSIKKKIFIPCGREIFQNTLKDWDLDYSEKKSLTNEESFLINVKKIKKKIKKN